MRPQSDQFIRPPTLTATVAEHIKEAIFRGSLLPGAPLHEVELSKSLGVSRGTVREALRYLQDETLVEIHPHQGASVTRLSPRKAREIYTLRAQLEPYAVRLAMGHRAYTRRDVDELDALVRRLGDLERSGDPEHRGHLFEIITADMEFHRVMCERSEHEMLMAVLKGLQSQTRLFILNTILYHSDLELDELTHRAILNALQSGDPEHAEAVVRKHIVDAGTSLMVHMEAHAGSAEYDPHIPTMPGRTARATPTP